MDPETFKALQKTLGWSDRQLANFLCCDPRNLRRWKTGDQDIPAWVRRFFPMLTVLATNPRASLRLLKEMVGL